MEIDITFMLESDLPTMSGSVAELGSNAARITWNNSMEYAAENIVLKTPEQVQKAKDWFGEFGAWDDDERAAWTDQEVNALLLQYAAGSLREFPTDDDGEIDFEEAGNGQYDGHVYKGDDGKIYIYVGI
jgi:uncharacterized protein (DUF2147 family)